MAKVSDFSRMLNEYMAAGFLPEPEMKKYYLIKRYEDKVSNRLIKERDSLLKRGDKLHTEFLLHELNKGSRLFKNLPKSNVSTGVYMPVPFKLGDIEGEK